MNEQQSLKKPVKQIEVTLGEYVQIMLDRNNIDQKEVAKEIDVSASTLSRYIKHDQIDKLPYWKLRRLAQIVEIDPEELESGDKAT